MKDFITCSKLIINELGLCPTRSNNVYFPNNEQASLAITDGFCFSFKNFAAVLIKVKDLAGIMKNLTALLMR